MGHGDVDPPRGLALTGASHADILIINRQEGLQPLGPLFQEFAPMHQNKGVHPSPCDQGSRDYGLAERGRGSENAEIMDDYGVDGGGLL